MYNKKNISVDRRISRSKHLLKEALVSLMQTKEFKEITIKDIVERADLNRGTFYKHYQYKEDLLEEIIEDVISDLITSYREPYMGEETFEVTKLTISSIKIFDHVEKHKEFYTLIVNSNTLIGFQNRISHVLKDLALHDLYVHLPNSKINPELQASYHAYAILGMIMEWIRGGFIYSSTYLAEQLLEYIKLDKGNAVYKFKVNG
jgi:AcrR family transcriptional regulator